MVEGGLVTEAALSDRRPLPRARRRCLWAALPDRWLERERRERRLRREVLLLAELEPLIAE